MNRIVVESSSINSVGYDIEKEVLQIEFKRGAVYNYYDVDIKVYNELIESESVGKYFSKKIARKYNFREVELL